MTELGIEVRHAATDVLLRYATGIDRRDWTLLRSCFTDDCDADYGALGRWRGGDEITAFMRLAHQGCGHTMHRITNTEFATAATGLTARAHVDSIVMGRDNRDGLHTAGFYDDDLIEADGGWRIARRRFTLVLMRTVRSELPSP